MQIISIHATRRAESGKGAASRLRRTGKIPAVAYGKGQQTEALAVSPTELAQVFSSERGKNTVVELDVEGKEKLTVLLRDYQYHPITRALLHADFLTIRLDQPVEVEVPFELVGRAQGVVLGGTLRQVFRRLPVRCLPEKIPVKITHDVTALGLDGHIATRDLALPEGVEVRLPLEQTLVSIVKEKSGDDEASGGRPSMKPEAAEKK